MDHGAEREAPQADLDTSSGFDVRAVALRKANRRGLTLYGYLEFKLRLPPIAGAARVTFKVDHVRCPTLISGNVGGQRPQSAISRRRDGNTCEGCTCAKKAHASQSYIQKTQRVMALNVSARVSVTWPRDLETQHRSHHQGVGHTLRLVLYRAKWDTHQQTDSVNTPHEARVPC